VPGVPERQEEERRAGAAPLKDIPHGGYHSAGTWHESDIRLKDNKSMNIVMMSCPTCGRDISLSDRTISGDGQVLGEVSCARGCGWKDEVKLVGWGKSFI